jgi:hypothetical protein
VTGLLSATAFTVDPWDPGYGTAAGDGLDGHESTARLDLDVELPAVRWRPVSPDRTATLPSALLFLDGVRRIDARVWVHNSGRQPVPGIAASIAAGLVCCDGAARILDVRVDRGLYTAAAAQDLPTDYGTYTLRAAGAGLDELSLAVQRRLSEVEVELALGWRTGDVDNDLLIVDGPLRGRTHLPRTVGYIKSHHRSYLPPTQAEVVATMPAGLRSPVFLMGTSWQRHSWYLRLPGATGAPWSAVVRLECAAEAPTADAVTLADLTARLLPALASTAHKDPRAPQNLVPIGGLERHLRHRLGDAALLYRALRAASATMTLA